MPANTVKQLPRRAIVYSEFLVFANICERHNRHTIFATGVFPTMELTVRLTTMIDELVDSSPFGIHVFVVPDLQDIRAALRAITWLATVLDNEGSFF